MMVLRCSQTVTQGKDQEGRYREPFGAHGCEQGLDPES